MDEHDWLRRTVRGEPPAPAHHGVPGATAGERGGRHSAGTWLGSASSSRVENLAARSPRSIDRQVAEHAALTTSRHEPMDPPVTGKPSHEAGERARPGARGDAAGRLGRPGAAGRAGHAAPGRTAHVRMLHDMFAVPFGDRRHHGALPRRCPSARRPGPAPGAGSPGPGGPGWREGPGDPDAERRPGEMSRRRRSIAAFLAAPRAKANDALLTMLDPDIVLRANASRRRWAWTAPTLRAARMGAAGR